MCGRRLKSMRTPELLAAHDALRAAKTWFNTWGFIAPCPICGRKNRAVEDRQDDDGRVRCCCKHCGAGKDAIYRAVGLEYKMDGQQTNGEEKRDMSLMCKRPMSADEIYGVNQCTTCVHYHVFYFREDAFYGCKKKNQYMCGAIWNRPGDDPMHPCEDYCADMPTLQANMDRLERYIEEISEKMNGYRMRLNLLKAIEQTHGAAHQTESHSPKTEAEP